MQCEWSQSSSLVAGRGGGELMGSRVEPLQICVDRTGGVAKYEEIRYGDHLLSKVAGNFYKGNGTK